MANPDQLQQALFSQLKERLPQGESLVDIIAELLSVSNDSAYRRIRGETAVTLNELKKICSHFRLSVDGLLHLNSDSILFRTKWSEIGDFNYRKFLESMVNDQRSVGQPENAEMLIYAKDFPVFYNFLIPEIAAFKSFFWHKTALNLDSHKQLKFDPMDIDPEIISLGNQIAQNFARMRSSELWNDEVLHSITSQVLFFHDSGYMKSSSVTELLLGKLEKLVDHFQAQAEQGEKFLVGQSASGTGNLKLYYNEVMIGDNTLVVRVADQYQAVFTHNVINTLSTRDESFARQTWEVHQNIIGRSTLISSSNEKERNKYFKRLRDRIDWVKTRL